MIGLSVDNLGFQHGTTPILQAIDLIVRPGETVALIGPNGAGKSTLLRLLAGELAPQTGHCRLDGRDMRDITAAQLARRRAVLPQHSNTQFPLRVSDVVALGRAPWRRHATPMQNRQAVAHALKAAGASRLRHRDYRQLSGGERQRVQLARVLAQVRDSHHDGQPRYLLLDEPTASLDIGHQQRLLRVIGQVLPQGIGVLAVLHDLNLAAAFADRLYLLDRGHIRATGTPEEVICRRHINAAYGIDLALHRHPDSGRPIVLPSS